MAPPQRQKNLRVHESTNSEQMALRNIIVNDSTSDDKELKFLELLSKKVELGILSQSDVDGLVLKGDPVEKLTIKILKNLNKFSTYSAQFQQIAAVMGSTSRIDIAKKLAERYVSSAALKNVVRQVVNQKDLGSLGELELGEDLGRQDALVDNPMSASQRLGSAIGSMRASR